MRRYFECLSARGVVVPPQDKAVFGRKHTPLRFTPSEDQVLAFMYKVQGATLPYNFAAALLPLFGLRDGEMCTMRFADWRVLDSGAVIFTVRQTKNGQDREAPMLRTAGDNGFQAFGRRLLREYLTTIRPSYAANSPWLFPQTRNVDKPITREENERYIREARDALDIPDMTAHAFRRFYVTYLLDRGVQAVTVAKMIGHSNMDTFSAYYRPTGVQLARAMEAV